MVAIGALAGMTTSLLGSMFALPRCVYAMAEDGLLFKWLAHVHSTSQVRMCEKHSRNSLQVPTTAVIVFGAITAVVALLFNIETLVEFLSIGTLMAYTIVSASVVILRYRPDRMKVVEDTLGLTSSKPSTPAKGKHDCLCL